MRENTVNMTPLCHMIILLASTAVSIANLSGENLCHKRETYTVTMRVMVKEPVQVKSYTWCLKVPPRCTKYKLEMRDKYKIQTELRERVVDMCCAGYAPDRTETQCLPVCNTCLHGVCVSPDTCTCEPGYTGDQCNTECREGLWGAECKEECLCKNGAECHHVTGDCKCSEGWRGTVCDVPCPKGTYGDACLKECNCKDNNSTCNHITGECYQQLPGITYTATTMKPQLTEADVEIDGHDSETIMERQSTTVVRTLVTNNGMTTISPTQTSIVTIQNIPLPNTEKHVLYIDKFTSVAPDTTVSSKTTVTTPMTTTLITATTTTPSTTTAATTSTTTRTSTTAAMTTTVTESSDITVSTREETENIIQHKFTNNSITKPPWPSADDALKEDFEDDKSNKLNSLDNPDVKKTENDHQTKEEEAPTEPENIQIPPRGIIVVSDGLMSDRRNEEERVKESKNSRDSFWDLVSSVSVAGGVALALIVMAALTLLVSHLRNKKKLLISGNKTNVTDQQTSQSGPQMYNYTEEVPTLPLRHLFPDATYQPSKVEHTSDGLQLRFGDIASAGQPHSDIRAYLELQYDIPPSSISSKTSSFQPGVEPEHLYDEIPCWRSNNITSTSTGTDTSRC